MLGNYQMFFTTVLTEADTTSSTIENIIHNFNTPTYVIDFAVSILFLVLITAFSAYKIRRIATTLFYIIFDLIFIISMIFDLSMLSFLAAIIIIGGTIVFMFINSGIIRSYVAIPLKKGKIKQLKTYDKEKVIQNIITAVNWLSANKVGALITFERSTPLTDFIKNGTTINCPVTPEIIETIFYEGTRLHDGAIVIKDDLIVAAAVYYPPSTKEIVGKFGARHRAALGISEITDAITIVVSEETGRISITHGGLIDNIKEDEFEKIFRNQIAD